MKPFEVEILTPARRVFKGQVLSLTVPGSAGEFQVLYNHAPLMSSFEIGKIKIITPEETTKVYATGGGVIEVLNNVLTLVADSAELPEEIDQKRATASAERAKKRISARQSGVDINRAEMALARALNRLKYKK
jgi:F-type H+-transporting ATPase subunit epsilon